MRERIEESDALLLDPRTLAEDAISELTLSANSGVFDHDRIAELRRRSGMLAIQDEAQE